MDTQKPIVTKIGVEIGSFNLQADWVFREVIITSTYFNSTIERFIVNGQALKLIRQYHNVKQSELASKISISNSYLSEVESGKKEVTIDLLKKYSEFFNLPMSSLMLFSENLEDNSIAEKFRVGFASKIKQIMEWVVAKDDHTGAKKV